MAMDSILFSDLHVDKKPSAIDSSLYKQDGIFVGEAVVKQVFTKDALSRYGNIKAAHPEKAIQVLVVLGQLIQQGKVNQINDAQLRELLKKLTPEKTDFKITRK